MISYFWAISSYNFPLISYFWAIFVPGPISGPIWFPISGRRPETYFLAGRLDRKAKNSLDEEEEATWSGDLATLLL